MHTLEDFITLGVIGVDGRLQPTADPNTIQYNLLKAATNVHSRNRSVNVTVVIFSSK